MFDLFNGQGSITVDGDTDHIRSHEFERSLP
jgi:hypothetical protein